MLLRKQRNKRTGGQSNDPEQQELVHRLHRVCGQLQGVEEMIEKKRDCITILHQLLSARSAIAKIATKLLAKESCRFATRSRRGKKLELLINELLKIQ